MKIVHEGEYLSVWLDFLVGPEDRYDDRPSPWTDGQGDDGWY